MPRRRDANLRFRGFTAKWRIPTEMWPNLVRHPYTEMIADAGLKLLEELGPAPDIGFRLIRSRWQRGLATEVAAAWALRSLTIHGLDRLNAFAHVDNVASHRVLEKVGFLR